MSKRSRTNHHSYHGTFATGNLPTDATVEVGDTAFDVTLGTTVECTAVGPVVWNSISAGAASVSLDDAYDSGGSGFGRSITVDSGSVDLSLASGSRSLETMFSGSSVLSLDVISSNGEFNARNVAATKEGKYKTDGIDYNIGVANTAIISSDGSFRVNSSGTTETAINFNTTTGDITFTTSKDSLTFTQASTFYGDGLRNTAGQIFHSTGTLGTLSGETSSSLVHALNTLGKNFVGQIASDGAIFKSGVTNVPVLASSVAVSFATAFSDNNYIVNTTVVNSDAAPEHITLLVKNLAAGGFTVVFSNQVLTGNYKIHWFARKVL